LQKPYGIEVFGRKVRERLQCGSKGQMLTMSTMKRILIIEDDQGVRAVIAAALSDAGYEVVEAADGKMGVNRYKDSPTDLVITDLIMPEKEGIETIIELRREFPEVKLIAISGGNQNGYNSNLSMAKRLGARRTLTKPFKLPDLLEAVRGVLDES
jgi:CheY-like chemotaxis protein